MLLWPGFSSKLDVTVTRLRCPDEAIQMLHDHYDLYKHEVSGHDLIISDWVFPSDWVNSIRKWFKRCGLTSFKKKRWGFISACPTPEGLPHEVLAQDYFVPGSCTRKEVERYKGKPVFSEILTTSNETLVLYFQRVTKDTGVSITWLHKKSSM